jgi:undecaprenyl-diphosphatase
MLLVAERAGSKTRGDRTLTPIEAVWIGCAQALALVPGVSRSGATLTVALLIGLRRADAARFIFLLAIPAILGAAASEAPRLLKAGLGDTASLFLIGIVVSAIVGYATVKYFIRHLGNHSLDIFGWYRIALAAVVAIWLLRP